MEQQTKKRFASLPKLKLGVSLGLTNEFCTCRHPMKEHDAQGNCRHVVGMIGVIRGYGNVFCDCKKAVLWIR